MPASFADLYETISTYAFTWHIDSQNAFFSNIINTRFNVVGGILNIIISYLFKKNVLYYHVFPLLLHLINTFLIWLIFYELFNLNNSSDKKNSIYPSLFTLLWSLHPANIEAVLLATNWTPLFTFNLCFGILLFYLKKIGDKNQNLNFLEIAFLIVSFITTLFHSEYSFTLPIILFIFLFSNKYKTSMNIHNSLMYSLKLCSPLAFGIVFYFVINFLMIKNAPTTHLSFSLDRTLWLSPQIFWHFLKLIFFPKDLSLYQTNLISLAHSYNNYFAIFKMIIFLGCIILPLLIFTIKRNSTMLIFYCFIVSLLTYLHIASPAYCLIAERYCYFPIFAFIFCILFSNTLKQILNKHKKMSISILVIILSLFFIKTSFRINNWKDSFALYSSALKCDGNSLYKGQIYSVLGYYFDSIGKKKEMKIYMKESIKHLSDSIKELEAKKTNNEIKTLKSYGLDTKSLITTCAFSIASTRLTNFKESPNKVLDFYRPYILSTIETAGVSQLDLYAKLLILTKQYEKALEVLKLSKEKYPKSSLAIYTLSNLYLKLNNLANAETIILEGYEYYPSYKRMLIRIIKLSELKKDYVNLAKYEYLLGFRTHSKEAYQKSVQLYLSLNNLKEAKKILDKLLTLDKENPITFLLLSKYYYLANEHNKILDALNHAYLASKDRVVTVSVYKSILLSLISFSLSYNDLINTQKYILEFESLPNILKDERLYIENLKNKYHLQ